MKTFVRNLILCYLSGAAALLAQQDLTVQWRLSLQDLERRLTDLPERGASAGAWRTDEELLRSSIASFAAANPDVQLSLPARLPESSSHDAMTGQLAQLNTAITQVVRHTPGTPFDLGHMSVDVSGDAAEASPVTVGIDQSTIANLNLFNAAQALDYLPGVSIQHLDGPRNEAGIMVRGFSSRGQVPLYIDGIPISVPYDGYVDFNRYLTSDISDIQVARGYSSPLMGPNAEGGSINMVTEEPVKKFDADALIGTASGDSLLSSLRLGSRWDHFFFQGSLDWHQQDYIPLSGNFPVNQFVNLPAITMTDHLNNSWSRDERYTGRIGWTPKKGDEYVLSYVSLKGEKGVPLYQGPDTTYKFKQFWEWPYWDTVNYYFHSSTQIGESSSLKFRAFYNQFFNDIDMYSGDTYVMNTPGAEHSRYNEHNDGFSTEYTTRAVSHNVISGSFFFKEDVHLESGIFPDVAPFPLTEPTLRDADIQTSIGLQDVIRLTPRLSATVGFSADHFDGLEGQAYNSANTELLPFTCIASPTNASFSGCTAHTWNYNPQVAITYATTKSSHLFLTFADRGRFPMLKDIYSAGLGTGLPNPNLLPEHALNWNLGFSQAIGTKTVAQVVFFRSNLHNAIESVYVTDPGGMTTATEFCPNSKINGYCSEMANIGTEVHEGVEFELHSTPLPRLTVSASYSYLNRDLKYNFDALPDVSAVNTSITILPTLPKSKMIASAAYRFPRQIMVIVNEQYEGGLTLQDTTYPSTSPLFLPFAESYATTDIVAIVPIRSGMSLQAGVKNLLDRNYYYTAGYPQEGRNWFLNLRYHY